MEDDAHRLIPGGSFVSPSLWINNARHANRRSLISQWVKDVHLNEATAITALIKFVKSAVQIVKELLTVNFLSPSMIPP